MEQQFIFTLQFATNGRADFNLWLNLASEIFECFTWYDVNGVWQGEGELSYKVEIINYADLTPVVKYLARYIKNTYKQECVLISRQKIDTELI